MYNDYSINESCFIGKVKAQLQTLLSTGQRYIHHAAQGIKELLFVREFRTDIFGTAPYTFLGLANYVQHSGNRPMNIIWRLGAQSRRSI